MRWSNLAMGHRPQRLSRPRTLLTDRLTDCRIYSTMTSQQPISDVLRDAINASGLPFLALEKATGVLRQTLTLFARGESGINSVAADKLAVYFGLELRPVTRKAATKAIPKRKGE